MKFDARHLEILAAIVDHGGLTEGAEAVGKSQPSVSRTLSQLEKRIGAPLFIPGKRPLLPTELGLALADQGRVVRTANMRASEIVTRFQRGKSGQLRIGGTPIFMDGVIATMIAEFQQQNPDVRIDQSYAYAEELIARLIAGTLDVAICPIGTKPMPGSIHFQPVLKGRNVIVCRAGHPLIRRPMVTPSDIARYPWITPATDSPLYDDLKLALASIGSEELRISFSGGTLASVVNILTASDSLTVLPFSVVFMMRRQKIIQALSLKIDHPPRALGILHAPGRYSPPVVTRIRSFVSAQFDSLSQNMAQYHQNLQWRP